jgi:archaemetzincin
LYVLQLGEMTAAQTRLIRLVANFMEFFFCLPVVLLPPALDLRLPSQAQRKRPQLQLKSSYLLQQLLVPRRPLDCAALIAFTAADLYPADDWNFVFGQASLQERVGVWSLWRSGDPGSQSAEERRLALRRTLLTAAHETAHVFSLPHCITHLCLLNGSNHQAERDRRPLEPCPVCLSKLAHALEWRADMLPVRYERLAGFWEEQGQEAEAAALRRLAAVVAHSDIACLSSARSNLQLAVEDHSTRARLG